MNNVGVEPQLQEGDFYEEEEETVVAAVKEREIWLQNNNHRNNNNMQDDDEDDLLASVLDDASLFYADDDFPSLPDFSCMSSSSSSSSSPPAATVKTVTCASSSSTNTSSSNSAASWANLRSDNVGPPLPPPQTQPPALSSTASMEIPQPPDHQGGNNGGGGGDCLDMMGTFGHMEFMETNEFFDPSSMFENGENLLDELTRLDPNPPEEGHASGEMIVQEEQQQQEQHQPPPLPETAATDEEMSSVFLEWLRMNKDSVSASDLRNVRLKKATIECAAKRLGGGKEGMKQLLKLILEWVQTSHLQKKRRIIENQDDDNFLMTQVQDTANPSSHNLNHQLSFGPEWIFQPPYGVDPAAAPAAAPPSFPQPLVGYNNNNNNLGDPFSNGASSEFHVLDSSQSWPHSQFTVYNNQPYGENNLHPTTMTPLAAAAFGGYGNQFPYHPYFHGTGPDRLGPLATKEARKKRMARQRRHSSHHRHHNVQDQQNQQNQSSDYCTAATVAPHANPPNWLYWPPVATSGSGAASVAPMAQPEPPSTARNAGDRTAVQSHQNYQHTRVSSDKRQGWKPEKNLKFLLQKVLKQSDVGNLGRIVLPKKEAESHLPELEERDGISIAMEDIGTSRVWNMRYRYWPNNKSRMYLLENTGDFVRANGLQEGDFIVIYSDVKCGKYMIRGVKVRQAGARVETKKGAAGKNQKANYGSPSSPKKMNEKKQ
ncbi:B3 domain-containing transcription factor ABI3-like [Prosopis cineraria]|uniref:B3 domain-containing transcription factor ABI3-like n=1 Tax=Prosopis cineraria TaxID=364024 RepID=UPI00240FE060|nr:B3 domain-containing transcription factor ABI3-like [Prosopis cineraria]